jgi:hypothetical protein
MLSILAIKEMQIQTLLRFYLTPGRMATIKTQTTNPRENGEKEPSYSVDGNVNYYNHYGKQNEGLSQN